MPRWVRVASVTTCVAVVAVTGALAASSRHEHGQVASLSAARPATSTWTALDGGQDRAFIITADRSRLLIADRAQALRLQARRAHALQLAAQERNRAAAAAAAARRAALVAAGRAAAAQQARAPHHTSAAPAVWHPTDLPQGGNYSNSTAWAASARATRLRQCESSDNYGANTGNGYYGAYQFSESTWQAVGGHGYPQQNSSREQDYRAYLLWQRSGWSAWGCG